MYYLLDNNLIINKNDKRIKNLTYSIEKTQTFVYLECDSKTPEAIFNCIELYYATRHLVVKQSENVLDLIDRENDLVKIELLGGYFNIVGAKTLNGNWKENDRISAIYKPDLKGNYIKVWGVVVDDK